MTADTSTAIWDSPTTRQFVETLLRIQDEAVLQNFLRDVMTEKEIIEISARLEAARMLEVGKKYTEISQATNLSSRTIARISDWMQNGRGGYAAVLAHRSHTLPARAE